MDPHYPHLLTALKLAAAERGHCAPNPAVGAVVVANDHIISQGAHKGPGLPHAEVLALENLTAEQLRDATLYITLEPCCHHGRTPPCTELIKQKKPRQVIYAYADPNPLVAGQGADALRAAGIACEHSSHPDIDAFYQSYTYWVQTRRPWVTVKLAMSLDAKIAAPDGVPVQLTGKEFQTWVHQQRLHSDGLLTTVNTVNHDDPQLNVRLQQQTICKPVAVLDSQLRLRQDARLMQTAQPLFIYHQNKVETSRIDFWQTQQAQCVAVSNNAQGQLDLANVFEQLGELGWHDVWVEAGGRLFSALVQQQLVQQVYLAIAPHYLGPEAIPAFPDLAADWLQVWEKQVWQILGRDSILDLKLTPEKKYTRYRTIKTHNSA